MQFRFVSNCLPQLSLPYYPFKMKKNRDGVVCIFDECKKKYLVLTPEEWVRQHFIQYIIRHKGYPKALIHTEGGMKLNSLRRRTDIIVYNSFGQKILLVECKAPSVSITQKVFDQISHYNITHKIPLLAVTNGINHYYCTINFENKTFDFLEDLPIYKS